MVTNYTVLEGINVTVAQVLQQSTNPLDSEFSVHKHITQNYDAHTHLSIYPTMNLSLSRAESHCILFTTAAAVFIDGFLLGFSSSGVGDPDFYREDQIGWSRMLNLKLKLTIPNLENILDYGAQYPYMIVFTVLV